MKLTVMIVALVSVFGLGCKAGNDESPATTASQAIEMAVPEPAAPAQAVPAQAVPAQVEPTDKLVELSVADAAKAIGDGALVFDANNDKTREEFGTVPNAVLLDSSSKYALNVLPENKDATLIFYCANTHCTASDAAAERAAENGYKNTRVMREGIKGWKDSGNPVQAYPRS
ncbi:MAG: rhodanese-like domain-containing protein [Polyangiales bacterium]